MSSSTVRNSFRVSNIKKFIASLNDESLYLGIGRPQFWDLTAGSDATITAARNNIRGETGDWEDLMFMKRIFPANCRHGFPKLIWEAGKKYDTYRHDYRGNRISVYDNITNPEELGQAKYVVLNSAYDIYICLKQGMTGLTVNQSLYSPETGVAVGVNTGIVKTPDGYYWKFIGKTSVSDLLNFSSLSHHPVQTLTVAPSIGDPMLVQWQGQVDSAAFKAGIYTINVSTSGSGYNGGVAGTRNVTNAKTDAEFKVLGNGTGLQCTVTYGTGGSIVDVEVTNPGSGYTYAFITATAGTGAAFDIIYTPTWGLGVDPVNDCSGYYLITSTTLTGEEGGVFTVDNDFRKVMMVMNPKDFGTTNIATDSIVNVTQTLTITGALGGSGAYLPDGVVTGASSAAKGRTVDWDDATGKLRYIRTSTENTGSVGGNLPFVVAETITSTLGSGAGTVSALSNPDVTLYSGDIIYVENRQPIMRSDSQEEILKVTLQF